MLSTIFAVILRIISNSFLNVSQKELSKEFSPLQTNFKTYFLLLLVCLPLFFAFYFKFSTCEIIIWAFIGGFFGAIGNAFLISALKYGELSILGPINSYKALVALIFGIIILGEFPSAQAIFGIILMILGSVIIFETTPEGFSFSLFKRKDICYRFLALVFSAIEAIFIKKVIILSDISCSFLLWVIFGFVFSYFILKINRKKAFSHFLNFKKEIFPFFPLAVLVFLMQFSTNLVFSKIPAASALSLFQLSNIVNVFLGYKIFKEKNLIKKLAGAFILTIASFLIISY